MREKLDKLEKKLKKSIHRAAPVYMERTRLDQLKQEAASKLAYYEKLAIDARFRVSQALEKLNTISEHVHELRKMRSEGVPQEELDKLQDAEK